MQRQKQGLNSQQVRLGEEAERVAGGGPLPIILFVNVAHGFVGQPSLKQLYTYFDSNICHARSQLERNLDVQVLYNRCYLA